MPFAFPIETSGTCRAVCAVKQLIDSDGLIRATVWIAEEDAVEFGAECTPASAVVSLVVLSHSHLL